MFVRQIQAHEASPESSAISAEWKSRSVRSAVNAWATLSWLRPAHCDVVLQRDCLRASATCRIIITMRDLERKAFCTLATWSMDIQRRARHQAARNASRRKYADDPEVSSLQRQARKPIKELLKIVDVEKLSDELRDKMKNDQSLQKRIKIRQAPQRSSKPSPRVADSGCDSGSAAGIPSSLLPLTAGASPLPT